MVRSAFVLVIAVVVAMAPAPAARGAGPSAADRIWSELAVGDVLGQGERIAPDSCSFSDGPVITTTVPLGEGARWIATEVGQDCLIRVSALWSGSIEAGPIAVVRPLASMLVHSQAEVPETQLPVRVASSADEPSAAAGPPCKSSEQKVFMYGAGGTWDQLTSKSGRLNFCWNGSQAWATSQAGGCTGSAYGLWSWVIDGCWVTAYVAGPSAHVYRSGKGSYHCSPAGSPPCWFSNPDGYYHSLFETENGYPNGTSSCSWSYSGLVVSGVSRTILAGCS
jgi:hypothetical protein